MKKIKKLLLGLVTFAAMAILCVVCAGAETYGDYEYEVLDDGTVEITRYYGSASVLEIPESIGGCKVTEIGSSAFSGNSTLTMVVIPDSVTSIGASAFYNCSLLSNVTLSKNIKAIWAYAFYGCTKLTSITIPKTLESCGGCAFEKTGITKANIENGATSVVDELFFNCTTLKEVTIPDTVISIGNDGGEGAFSGCSSLTTITIPNSVKSIGGSAFSRSGLVSITIPDSVKSIGSSAFYDCSALSKITLPKYITTIGSYVFYGCTGLTSITIPKTLESCGGYVFEKTGITKAEIENGATSVLASLFTNCTTLKEVIIPDTVISIGNSAFSGCSSLSKITIPDSVTSIGGSAFSRSGLVSIAIPYKITEISSSAFLNCSSLEEVSLPSNLKAIYTSAFNNCTSLKSIAIPDMVTSIGGSAFYNCNSLVSVEIPDSVTSIGSEAFYKCISLTSVKIPAGVKQIGSYAFGYYYDSETSAKTKIPDFKIYCYSGTAGETYAKENGFEYELLGAKPTAITGLTVSASTSTSLSLNWTKIDSATGYFVQQYKNGEWTHVRQLARNTATTYTATGLTPSTTYQYRVRAYYTDGSTTTYSDYTTVSGTTNPSNISGVKAASTANSVTISWNKNSSATGYFVQQYKNGAWTHVRQLARNTATTFTASGLNPSTKYQYRIRAYYTSGDTTVYGEYKYVSPTTRPTDLTGIKASSTANSITISWDKNNTATGYFIQQYKDGKWTHVRQLARNTATTYTATGLNPSTKYQYRIRAYYTDGTTTTYSDYKYVSPTTRPTNLTGVKVTSTANTVTLSWAKNDSATGYFIQQYKNGVWTHVRQLARNTVLSYTATGLTPSTTYQYRIRAYYTDGTTTTYSDYTQTLTVTTKA